ncbi:hypothetical protein MMC20_002954 [Loxospora ochrophaea]|nr:hypothetical protein [Loxospora ochrophaea]
MAPKPSSGAVANRRFLVLLLTVAGFLSFTYIGLSRSSAPSLSYQSEPIHHVAVAEEILKGDAIMPKLGNETLKAELGRAAWKLFHTTMARFPDQPTQDEQTALTSYIHLFARLYPCGECAGHFRSILKKFPPQASTRSTAAAWACHVHNEVNKSLQKPVFDCTNIGDFYDCGCAEDEEDGGKKIEAQAIDPAKGELKLEKEGETLGG